MASSPSEESDLIMEKPSLDLLGLDMLHRIQAESSTSVRLGISDILYVQGPVVGMNDGTALAFIPQKIQVSL